jgi:hypothetical protein
MLAQLIVTVAAPLRAWHGVMNSTMLSDTGSHLWMAQQLEGDFSSHVRSIVRPQSDPASLARCGLVIAGEDAAPGAYQGNNELPLQDELASLMGEFALTLAARRWHRTSFLMVGWPLRLVGLCGSEDLKHRTLQAFRTDFECYGAMQAQAETAAIRD